MCGLVGCASSYLGKTEKDIFSDLMYVSAMRGWDSAGAAAISLTKDDFDWHTAHSLGPSIVLLNSANYVELMKVSNSKVLIGHTRAATVGTVSIDNAHPFDFDHIVGVHNGTLHGDYPFKGQYQTDSEALYAAINQDGVENVIPNVSGAWALVWFDQAKSTLNFLRNAQRDLYLAFCPSIQSLFWASERGILKFVLDRRGMPDYTMVKLTSNTLVSLDISKSHFWTKPAKTKLEGKSHVIGGGLVHAPFLEAWGEIFHLPKKEEKEVSKNEQKSTETTTSGTPTKNDLNVNSTDTSSKSTDTGETTKFVGYQGRRLTAQVYLNLISNGCAVCGHRSLTSEPHRWISATKYLCAKCKDSPVLLLKEDVTALTREPF